jgi:ammonia channel protein AmtB
MSFVVNSTYLEEYVTAAIAAQTASFGAAQADTFWLLICGFLVFFMQCGFALLEAGTVRAKNTKNILLKNMLDACVGALIWYSIGYMVAVRTHACL